MKKLGILIAFIFCLGLTSFAPGTPVNPMQPNLKPTPLSGFQSKSFSVAFRKNKRASVIVYGNGYSPLGLYIYDEHGNCIARDDEGLPKNWDDCAVVWYPLETKQYLIEVKNLGALENKFQMAVN